MADKDYGIAPIKMPLDKSICISRDEEEERIKVVPTPSQYDHKSCRECSLTNLCASVKKAYNVSMKVKMGLRTAFEENDLEFKSDWFE